MKNHFELKRKEHEFHIGDWGYLCLQPYRQVSISQCCGLNMSPRYYSSFQVLQRDGSVANNWIYLPLQGYIPHFTYLNLKVESMLSSQSYLSFYPWIPLGSWSQSRKRSWVIYWPRLTTKHNWSSSFDGKGRRLKRLHENYICSSRKPIPTLWARSSKRESLSHIYCI